jgi:hypothetical protein
MVSNMSLRPQSVVIVRRLATVVTRRSHTAMILQMLDFVVAMVSDGMVVAAVVT